MARLATLRSYIPTLLLVCLAVLGTGRSLAAAEVAKFAASERSSQQQLQTAPIDLISASIVASVDNDDPDDEPQATPASASGPSYSSILPNPRGSIPQLSFRTSPPLYLLTRRLRL